MICVNTFYRTQCTILGRVRVANLGFRIARHAAWPFFNGKISSAAEQLPDFDQACPPPRQYMNGRVLSDIEKECEGGKEGLFPGHKQGQSLYAVAASQSNLQFILRWPNTVSVFTEHCDIAHLLTRYRRGVTLAQSCKQALSRYCLLSRKWKWIGL